VLCCGFGETEVFKLSDFGLARVSSVSTFGNVLLGTPGYCAPEQSFPDKVEVGPYTDVFGMACTVYFLLTGEPYFNAPSIPEMLVAVQSPERRSILDARGLATDIRERRALCLELDRELARATRADPRERHQTTSELAAGLLPLLSSAPPPSVSSSTVARRETRASTGHASPPNEWRWTIRRGPGDVASLCSVGWESNGHFLAASRDGLLYWDGVGFRDVPFDWPWVPREVRRSGAGRWLLAGDHGVLADFAGGKIERRVSAGNGVHFVTATGRYDDIVIAAAKRSNGAVELWAWISGHFMEPLALPQIADISGCAGLTDTAWLFTGRALDGAGCLLEFRPLGHRARVVASTPDQTLSACASDSEAGATLAGGERGYVASVTASGVKELLLLTDAHVSAVAVDPLGRQWAATPGALWSRDDTWEKAWSEPSWSATIVSILADVGRVVAVTADGAIVQAEQVSGFRSR